MRSNPAEADERKLYCMPANHAVGEKYALSRPERVGGHDQALALQSFLRALESARTFTDVQPPLQVRCDGNLPCEPCKFHQRKFKCHYRSPDSSPSTVTETSSRNENHSVRQRSCGPSATSGQPSSINTGTPQCVPNEEQESRQDATLRDESVSIGEVRRLEHLQAFPGDSPSSAPTTYDSGPTCGQSLITRVTDDVNALSNSATQSFTYLGISSVRALLRVIAWLDPTNKALFAADVKDDSELGHAEGGILRLSPTQPLSVWDEVPAINAFFELVHPLIPLIDEDDFRATYIRGNRQDARWKLLSNTIMAVGSMAIRSSDDAKHHLFYERAKLHLNLEIFSMPHIETVQALGILGGYYCHYRSEPNLANSMMGMTLRMAVAIGLHRDYSEAIRPVRDEVTHARVIDLRRRVWWCLLIVDAWNAHSLGRPTMGRIGPGQTTKVPEIAAGPMKSTLMLFRHSIDFCILSTRLEDALNGDALMNASRRYELDHAFAEWIRTLPDITSEENPPSPGVVHCRKLILWRCMIARILIYRPVLLWYAICGTPYDQLTRETCEAIAQCRHIAADTIREITSTWRDTVPTHMAGWTATWQLYQAATVPLLSLYCDHRNAKVVEQSRAQVLQALETLRELTPWSPTAEQSHVALSSLYEAFGVFQNRLGGEPAFATSALPQQTQGYREFFGNHNGNHTIMNPTDPNDGLLFTEFFGMLQDGFYEDTFLGTTNGIEEIFGGNYD